jgi:nuclear cap-binding protein subunit 1
VLAAIERTKDRLTDAGAASDAARTQIISAVMAYWAGHPGVAVSIVEKLLNYSILSPTGVINWALVNNAGDTKGDALSRAYVYELVFNTVMKVTGRVRQVARRPTQPEGMADGTLEAEVRGMRELFRAIQDALGSWASGSKDELIEMEIGDGEGKSQRESLIRRWGERWLRAFSRRMAIEETFLVEASKQAVVDETNGSEGSAAEQAENGS